MDPIGIIAGLVVGFVAGFLVAAHNAKQAAATQSAIAAVHATVAEVQGMVGGGGAPAAADTSAPKAT